MAQPDPRCLMIFFPSFLSFFLAVHVRVRVSPPLFLSLSLSLFPAAFLAGLAGMQKPKNCDLARRSLSLCVCVLCLFLASGFWFLAGFATAANRIFHRLRYSAASEHSTALHRTAQQSIQIRFRLQSHTLTHTHTHATHTRHLSLSTPSRRHHHPHLRQLRLLCRDRSSQ